MHGGIYLPAMHENKLKNCGRILTLFLTKDDTTFVEENYERVRCQKSVDQDIYIVSAKPIGNAKNNIVIHVPEDLPVPLRIGLTIRMALKKIDIARYTYIFKVDGDVKLPSDYLINLINKRVPIAGIGSAFVISTSFFFNRMSGKYPLNYCDDGYILALGASTLGMLPPRYDGIGIIETSPTPISKEVEHFYGIEYYKFGLPLKILLLNRLLLFVMRNPLEGLKGIAYCISGYLSAVIRKEKRYDWWKTYSRIATSPHSWKIYLQYFRKVRPLKTKIISLFLQSSS